MGLKALLQVKKSRHPKRQMIWPGYCKGKQYAINS